MQYKMKSAFISGRTIVTDKDGNTIYTVEEEYVEPKSFRLTRKKFSLKDAMGKKLSFLTQISNRKCEINTETETFYLTSENKFWKINLWGKLKYSIINPVGEDLVVRITKWGNKWELLRGEKVVFTATIPFWRPAQPINIPDEEDQVLLISIYIGLSMLDPDYSSGE